MSTRKTSLAQIGRGSAYKAQLVAATLVASAAAVTLPAHAQSVIIDFDNLMTNGGQVPFPVDAFVSQGVIFSCTDPAMGSPNPPVATAEIFGNGATSPPNSIMIPTSSGLASLRATFVDPVTRCPAVTDFVSAMVGDKSGEPDLVTMTAFSISGTVLGTSSYLSQTVGDFGMVSIAAQGIYRVQLVADAASGGADADDFTFGEPIPVPGPGASVINFDCIDTYEAGTALISDEFRPQGVEFASIDSVTLAVEPAFVMADAVFGNLATSLPNGLSFRADRAIARATFFDPTSGCPAVTDFVSAATGDRSGEPDTTLMTAFGIGGEVLGTSSYYSPTTGYVGIVSVSAPGIHRVEFRDTNPSGATLDDFTFGPLTVVDDEPPLVAAPAAAAYECESQVPTANPADAAVTDNCQLVAVTVSDADNGGGGSAGSPLIITRTYTATDAAGNSAVAEQIISVIDVTPPSITAPPAVNLLWATTFPVPAASVNLGSPTASDDCELADVTNDAPASYPEGTTTVTWTAIDVHGLTSTAAQTVTITAILGAISGVVLADCPQPNTSLYGVKIDAFEEGTGDLVANAVTDENGYFEMLDVMTGDYVVTIVTPLGYDATSDEILIAVVGGETSAADFSLSCVPIVAEPRTIGFWKHQVGVALGGHGNAQLDGPTLCGLLDDIEAHFNNSPQNPVVVYVPPAAGECMDKLEAAKQLLNLRGNVHMSARAKQQLTALLLNVVVGYIHQAAVISGDGRTVSQAITYCDELIDTGADYELAKTIADLINNNQSVPDGWIPADTPNYSYSLPLVRQVPKGHFMVTPNPGLLARTFSFGLGNIGWVTLDIYDAAGRLVATPFSGELDPGPQAIRWDGLSARGARLAHGQYFARLTMPAGQQTIKVLVLDPSGR